MKKIPIAFILLASCSSGDPEQGGGNQSAPGEAQPQRSAPGRITTLTGLYEGSGDPKHQMCIVKGKGAEQRFGLVIWGSGLHSCSGSGTVTREGDRLKLAMAGDSACTVEATISGSTVKMPATVSEGCAYYCGARATLGGAELSQAGATESDAMKAKDLVGDPLCGEKEG